jgi:hypothetical protein
MSTLQQPPSQPEIPAEVWLLWNATGGHWAYDGDLMAPLEGRIACLSERDAIEYAEYLHLSVGITAVPVRVK